MTMSQFYLPSVDIQPFLQNPRGAAAQVVIEDVRKACLSTGFFQLTGHGVPAELQKRLFDASAKFFALPLEVKLKLDRTKSIGFRGYEASGVQSYETDTVGDVKESFVLGTDFPLEDPRVVQRRFFAGQNIWPNPVELAHHEFRDVVMEYYDAMMHLNNVVLDLVAATLPYGPHIFNDFRANELACPLRLLHYPPTPESKEGQKRVLGASAHTDFGAITLLLQDENAGLEILDRQTDSWIGVPPNHAAYVVNIGDMLSKITNNHYKSSVHRVVNRSARERYSAAFFFDGNIDYRLQNLDLAAAARGDDSPITAEEYIFLRVRETYGAK